MSTPHTEQDSDAGVRELSVARAGFDAFITALYSTSDDQPDKLPTFENLDPAERAAWLAAFKAAIDTHLIPDTPYPTPAHREAWEQYRAHPDVINAQSVFAARETELAPLRAFYNDQMNKARLAFQVGVNQPMYDLTQKLRALDDAQNAAPPQGAE